MGLLDRLLGRGKASDGAGADTERLAEECGHTTIAPQWENPDDIGKEELATAWVCGSCGSKFSADEAKRLMAEHERTTLTGDS